MCLIDSGLVWLDHSEPNILQVYTRTVCYPAGSNHVSSCVASAEHWYLTGYVTPNVSVPCGNGSSGIFPVNPHPGPGIHTRQY